MGPVERELRHEGEQWMSGNGRIFYGSSATTELLLRRHFEAHDVLTGAAAALVPANPNCAEAWSEAIEAAEALGL